MRKWLKRIGIVLLAIIVLFAAFLAFDNFDGQTMKGRIKNDELPVIKAGWEGNPVDQKGRFMNDEFPYTAKLVDVLRWKLIEGNKFKEEKASDKRRVEVLDPGEFLASDQDGIMWMGHASFYIRIGGKTILTDPVFGDPSFLKRFVPVPTPIDKLKSVDIILISHDHRDHTDENSIKALAAKFPNAVIIAGLRSNDLLSDWAPNSDVRSIGWFQQIADVDGVKVSFVPVRHWSRRGLLDTNWRLWGGYVIERNGRSIYFGGDSGYGRHYAEVGELFPKIDAFLVGIGAYEPRWFMEPNHNSPDEAVKGFVDAKAGVLIPMHYGTFDLSDEPPGKPLDDLMNAAKEAGVSDRVKVLGIYGTYTF